MSNAVNIVNALIQSVLNASLPYPIKWPNAPFDQPDNATFVRVTPLLSSPIMVALNKTDRVDGVLQIDVFAVKSSGDLIGYEVADTLRQSFPNNGESISEGGVNVFFKTVGIMGGAESEEAFYRTMIESSFYAYVDRTA